MSKRVQFYAKETATGTRRIFSFKVESKADAIRALDRFNIPAGWYKPDSKKMFSEKITNKNYLETKPETFFDRLDKWMAL